ncbi:MAG: TrbI/VirB10 family protein [Acidobacteriota bacterium]
MAQEEGVQLHRKRITAVVAVVSVGLSAVLAYLLFAPTPKQSPSSAGKGLPAVAEVDRLVDEQVLGDERRPPRPSERPKRRLGWDEEPGPSLDELLSRPTAPPPPTPWPQHPAPEPVDPWEEAEDDAYRQALRGRLKLQGRRQAEGSQAAGRSGAPDPLHDLEAALGLTSTGASFRRASSPEPASLDRQSPGAVRAHRPRGGLVVPRGTVIQAALTSGVQSDLPGQVTARVTRDVYAEGLRRVAIPAGTVLLGDYAQPQAFGHDRLAVVWDALRLPDGRRYEVQALAGSDRQGRAGLADRVDHHTWPTLGRAALVGLVSAAFQLGQPVDERGDGRLSEREVAAGAVSRELERATGELVRSWAARPPTIELRPGLGLQVVVREDLVFS